MRIGLRVWHEDTSANTLVILDPIYKDLVKKRPFEIGLRIDYGLYLLFAKRDNLQLMSMLTKLSFLRKKMSPFELYAMWTLRHLRQHWVCLVCFLVSWLQLASQLGETSQDFANTLEEANDGYRKCLQKISSFWTELQKASPDPERLVWISKGLQKTEEKTNLLYLSLIKEYPNSAAALKR